MELESYIVGLKPRSTRMEVENWRHENPGENILEFVELQKNLYSHFDDSRAFP